MSDSVTGLGGLPTPQRPGLKSSTVGELLSGGSSKSKGSRGGDEALLNIAKKRSADTLKFTHFMLKTRLAEDMEKVLAEELDKYPELKGNIFIGFITDENFTAEIIPMDEAVQAVTDASEEEAAEVLSQHPVGYFKRADFTLSTKNDPAYQSIKNRLDDFNSRNQDIMDYLRSNPQNDVDATELYSAPN